MFRPWLLVLLLLFLLFTDRQCTAQDYPDVRFTNWERLSSEIRRLARQGVLNYDRASWNTLNSHSVESLSYESLTDNQRIVVDEIVPSQESWDCYVNHFEDYSWEELQDNGIHQYYAVLGWNSSSWDGDISYMPTSNSEYWNDLTRSEREAAEQVCYFEELWNEVSLDEWESNQVDLTSSPTREPTTTSSPTKEPTVVTTRPTRRPSSRPTTQPTERPTSQPTHQPTPFPILIPTDPPAADITDHPTNVPIASTPAPVNIPMPPLPEPNPTSPPVAPTMVPTNSAPRESTSQPTPVQESPQSLTTQNPTRAAPDSSRPTRPPALVPLVDDNADNSSDGSNQSLQTIVIALTTVVGTGLLALGSVMYYKQRRPKTAVSEHHPDEHDDNIILPIDDISTLGPPTLDGTLSYKEDKTASLEPPKSNTSASVVSETQSARLGMNYSDEDIYTLDSGFYSKYGV